MEELFSCRNCVHNSGQSLNIGLGKGYCQFHSSVIDSPFETTCKYLHRKDLPRFSVDEAIKSMPTNLLCSLGWQPLKRRSRSV